MTDILVTENEDFKKIYNDMLDELSNIIKISGLNNNQAQKLFDDCIIKVYGTITLSTTKDFAIPQDMQSSDEHLEIIDMDKKIKKTTVALIKPCRDCPYKKSYDYPFNISLGSF